MHSKIVQLSPEIRENNKTKNLPINPICFPNKTRNLISDCPSGALPWPGPLIWGLRQFTADFYGLAPADSHHESWPTVRSSRTHRSLIRERVYWRKTCVIWSSATFLGAPEVNAWYWVRFDCCNNSCRKVHFNDLFEVRPAGAQILRFFLSPQMNEEKMFLTDWNVTDRWFVLIFYDFSRGGRCSEES